MRERQEKELRCTSMYEPVAGSGLLTMHVCSRAYCLLPRPPKHQREEEERRRMEN